MATTSERRALSTRSMQPTILPNRPRLLLPSFKRPRSPERDDSRAAQKRVKPTSSNTSTRESKKDRHAEREQQRHEFKEKYTRAFPNWSFYVDCENIQAKQSIVDELILRIEQLGGKVEDFFSRSVTHLITDKPVPQLEETKENHPNHKHSPYPIKSPVKLKSRVDNNEVVAKAASYGIKIWNSTKLDSVLIRCLDATSVFAQAPAKPQPPPTRQLERLLTKEKIHGPSDRDPLQRRHDYRYFAKGSFFVLVEDIWDQVATIAVHEYPPTKDQKGKVPWPILHCHPQARGPFIRFDEKEKARWERAQKAKNKAEAADRKEQVMQQTRKQAQLHVKAMGDLRRSVSLNNLHKRMVEQGKENQEGELDGDALESANASGFLVSGNASGYMAASGNSVTITSTTGTTSTASGSLLRHGALPSAMDGMLKRQVLTSRKALGKDKKLGNMDPPSVIPNRQPLLRKSKSTNTLKLPKREEGSKPGYCESCRQKFEDFKSHVTSSRHRRFAENDSNFVQLDTILDRIQRRPLSEMKAQEARQVVECEKRCRQKMAQDASLPLDSETP
ncbi:hypothetical protein CC1G_07408 [Coprinopsis cinerea okayama7|uniref:DBF4-type domain-containing protein n=1 Tax=Coprinopsis cinerea (strain Okayama-7 / 130 / ATCC MYA-4618 / FGSC 9003) TaxID=240176 RepID=A8N6N7_COPC7|nr:hypothetical protein CC1G_07408 [Coprinopsis cinerea okayama7\|eukprot:XP_001830493.2 hypothetical protein CC1G_07408 [Coprinopsis cinerea okayama7\